MPGVSAPAVAVTEAHHQDATAGEAGVGAGGPVAVFLASGDSVPARLRVLWWMPRPAAVRLRSDPRTSWKRSALHWTAQVDPDARGVEWEFVADRRPEETAALFAELSVTPLSPEEVQGRKPGTCHPEHWCSHAWPCGRDFEEWKAKQPKSKSQLRAERQEAARTAKAAPAAPAAAGETPGAVEPHHQVDDSAGEAGSPACDGTIRYVVPVPAAALCGNSLQGVCTCGATHWAVAVDEPRPGRRAEVCDRIVKRWGYERAGDWRGAGDRVAVRPVARPAGTRQATPARPALPAGGRRRAGRGPDAVRRRARRRARAEDTPGQHLQGQPGAGRPPTCPAPRRPTSSPRRPTRPRQKPTKRRRLLRASTTCAPKRPTCWPDWTRCSRPRPADGTRSPCSKGTGGHARRRATRRRQTAAGR